MSEKPIRLLLATGLYAPEIGGPATYTEMLEELLEAHNVEVVTVPFGTVRHLPKVFRHVAYLGKLLKMGKQVDIVYALDSISVGVPSYFASFMLRKPFLIRLGGDYAWEQGQQRFGLSLTLDEYTSNPKHAPFMVRLLASIQRFVVGRAVRVIAPSAYLKSIIASWGVPQEKIMIIYSALFPLRVEESRTQLREQLAYDGTVVVSVGRLVPWKGFLELIEAVAALRTDIPDIKLVIIGDGPQLGALQARIATLGLQNIVRLIGRMGKETLGAAIKAADVFVLNTTYEGLSHQLLEVMDLGVPIVTTNVGGNPELIKDGVSGFLVEPHDEEALIAAIKRIAESEDLRVRMVQNARVRTRDFSKEVVVAKLVEKLREITQK